MKIDVGCGERPAQGFDIYTDVYTPKAVIPGNFYLCSMEKMPFIDKQFEYARCHHVIEHTADPDKSCRELIRIAKSGTLWFPTPQAEILFGRADHRWFVFIENKTKLLFVARRFRPYGVKIKTHLEQRFDWKDTFEWTVVS
jgi:ubiquinone/menaquinone biosynthesis C-methylase UbiE